MNTLALAGPPPVCSQHRERGLLAACFATTLIVGCGEGSEPRQGSGAGGHGGEHDASAGGRGSGSLPGAGEGAVAGNVRLRGALFSEVGEPQGMRSVDDATGLLVQLRTLAGAEAGTAWTSNGRYRFERVKAGSYVVVVPLDPATPVQVGPLDVADAPVQADLLTVEPVGVLSNPPNPMAPKGLGFEFTLASNQHVVLDVLDLGLRPVWSYDMDLGAGFQHVHWAAINTMDQSVPPGLYWMRLQTSDGYAYNLAFRDP